MDEPLHEIAMALLVRPGRGLLVHRHPSREFYPDCWDLVGGHVEPGETFEQAVCRECEEEIGVRLRDPRRTAMKDSDTTIRAVAFVVTSWTGEPRNLAPDEHDDLRWFAPEEIEPLDLADPAMRPDIIAAVRGTLA